MNDTVDVLLVTISFIISAIVACLLIKTFLGKESYINNITSDNLYDLVMTESPFDLVNISDSIEQKEQKLDVLNKLLNEKQDIDIRTLSSEEIINALQMQLGFDYEPKYFKHHDNYVEVVMQYTGKMYGILIVIPKAKVWQPDIIGIIFDDKMNMFMGTEENTVSQPEELLMQ